MEEEIIYKLNEFLKHHIPFSEECEIVYLMVELRKLLDRVNNRDGKYSVLRFYCNWTVHIDKDPTNHVIVDVIHKIENSIEKGHKFKNSKVFFPLDNSWLDFVSMNHLKLNMQDFFGRNNLPIDMFTEENWPSFRDLFIQTLIDQPIKKPTENIETVYFAPAIKGAVYLIIRFRDGCKEPHKFLMHF
jgi:hypothetical protein